MSDLTHLFTIGQPVRCRLDLEAEEPLNQELDYSVVNSDTEQVLVDWE